MTGSRQGVSIDPEGRFLDRHVGSDGPEIRTMLETLGLSSLDELVEQTVPASIRLDRPLDLPAGITERELQHRVRQLGKLNKLYRSYLGMGYYGTVVPGVIKRNVLENPGWYTQYTPYQAEIAQGRLEALLNFQTAVMDLTALDIANASLLDEGTAAAEAMHLLHADAPPERNAFLVEIGRAHV